MCACVREKERVSLDSTLKKLESHLFTPSSAHLHSSLVVTGIELTHVTTHLTHSQIRTNAVAPIKCARVPHTHTQIVVVLVIVLY